MVKFLQGKQLQGGIFWQESLTSFKEVEWRELLLFLKRCCNVKAPEDTLIMPSSEFLIPWQCLFSQAWMFSNYIFSNISGHGVLPQYFPPIAEDRLHGATLPWQRGQAGGASLTRGITCSIWERLYSSLETLLAKKELVRMQEASIYFFLRGLHVLFQLPENKDGVDGEVLPLVHAEGADHILLFCSMCKYFPLDPTCGRAGMMGGMRKSMEAGLPVCF